MAFNKKTWKDRVSEQPQRRLLTPTSGGSSYTVDVQRQEGIVVQEGDAFSAANMNDLENRIKSTFDADEATLSAVNNKANTNAGNITTLQSNVNTLNNSKAPNNHASTAETYGKGSTSAFGHLKISDNYTASAGDASMGVAASSKAVVDARNNAINTAASDATSKANAAQSAAISTAANDATNKANAAQSAAISAAASDATTKANAAYNNANNASTTRYNDIVSELTANNKRIYMDYQGGKYGYNTSANRGADTFHPFKQDLTAVVFPSSLQDYIGVPGTYNLGLTITDYEYLVCYLTSWSDAKIGVYNNTLKLMKVEDFVSAGSIKFNLIGGQSFTVTYIDTKNISISYPGGYEGIRLEFLLMKP